MNNQFWLIAIGAVVIVAVMVVQWRLHKKRVAAFTALARKHGWRYRERDRALGNRYQGTPFGKGHGRTGMHVFTGQHRGRRMLAFEYIYKESSGSGKDRRTTTYRHTVVGLTTERHCPTLEVSREGFGRKLLGLVGVRDLQLESEQFNDTFRIRTTDDKFAYDILHPRMMEWMLSDQRALTLPFRFERGDLVCWDDGRIDERKLLAQVDYLCDVLERTPDFVWNS